MLSAVTFPSSPLPIAKALTSYFLYPANSFRNWNDTGSLFNSVAPYITTEEQIKDVRAFHYDK